LESAFDNSSTAVRDSFVESIQNAIHSIETSGDFSLAFRAKSPAPKGYVAILGDLKTRKLNDLYVLPSCFRAKFASTGREAGVVWALSIVTQSLRLAALLHDLGHPPFSHVAEHALEVVLDKANEGRGQSARYGQVADAILQVVKAESAVPRKALHEALGLKLVEYLWDALLNDLKEECVDDDYFATCFLLKHTVLAILRDDGFFACLHKIVDSELDVDRLDYVQRDPVASGYAQEAQPLGRLLTSFRIVPQEEGQYLFAPDIRALSTIEEFFRRRVQLYRYVVYHHRVAKFDGLLEMAILEHTNGYLNSNTDEKGIQLDGLGVPSSIEGLWYPFLDQFVNPLCREAYLVQWDDVWLLNWLRREYFQMAQNDRKPRPITSENSSYFRLEEFVTNRRRYLPLYKRADGYLVVEKAIWSHLEKTTDDGIRRGRRLIAMEAQRREYVVEAFKEGKRLYSAMLGKGDADQRSLVQSQGWPSRSLLQRIQKLEGGKQFVRCLLDEATAEFGRRHKGPVCDIFGVLKLVSPGVSREFELVGSDGKLVMLSEVSGIADEMVRESRAFPCLFAYFLSPKVLSIDELARVQDEYGRSFGVALEKWLCEQ
jgi:hypothetical protein